MISKEDSNSVLIVAAEDSSALYALRLLEHWKSEKHEINAFGIGSRAMENAGFEVIGRSESLAVVGLQEVIAHWSVIKETFYRLIDLAAERKPKFALLLDYPDFNLRLAKKLKSQGIKVIYYISPQIWAWRKGRVKIIKKYVDRVLTIFPFENQFYEKHGVDARFVGHPLLDELTREGFTDESRKILREKFAVSDEQVVLGLMPGSRRSEINHHLEVQLQTAERLVRENRNLRVFLMIAPGVSIEEIQGRLGHLACPVTMIKEEPFKMIHMTDLILCASGTATMMVGLMKKPMVIMYRMNAVTSFLARMLVRHSKFFGMVNLILDREVVPERFQEKANPGELCRLLQAYLHDKQLKEKTEKDLSCLQERLGDLGATKRVAESLEEYFQ